MDITIFPGKLAGEISAIPSKSQAHRLLICAALADAPTTLLCPETNRDIEATAGCLRSLGAEILQNDHGFEVIPIKTPCKNAILSCHDSGSTLRFLLPVVGALGCGAVFQLEGRLPHRPLSPLWEEMTRMGCQLSRPTPDTVQCNGQLRPGKYIIDGGVSSQFITGLLLAAAILPGDSAIVPTGRLESRPYIDMTLDALKAFSVESENFALRGGQLRSPGRLTVEGDWSNGAFFLAAQALGCDLKVGSLSPSSSQGDRAAAKLIPQLKEFSTVSAADIPDLVPILSVVAACIKGAVFTDIRRLRLKESDRVASVIAMLNALGGRAEADENSLTVYGTGLTGGVVDSVNDHRIAMSAAIAATVCRETVTVQGAECVEKSYPKFWSEYSRLGGNYEQYLR